MSSMSDDGSISSTEEEEEEELAPTEPVTEVEKETTVQQQEGEGRCETQRYLTYHMTLFIFIIVHLCVNFNLVCV